MPIVASVFAFASVTGLVMYFFVRSKEPSIKERVEEVARLGRVPSEREQTLARPLLHRVASPIANKVSGAIVAATPKSVLKAAERKLDAMGNPWNLTPGEYVILRIMTLILIPIAIAIPAGGFGSRRALLFALVALGLGWVVPEVMMQSKAKQRGKDIQKALPDVLDLLTVSVEAGLGFDAALVRVVERRKGPLSDEFGIVLREMRVGTPRREALKQLAERVKVDDITSLTSAIIQTDHLGVGIANILRIQSDQSRVKRRQKVEESAMKAPIKMLFPLVFFIFPTLFVVLLGPAVIQIAETLLGF
ncbi:MAG TPA: type II secretion system F family protein [Firmicutes bacterium]|jgi:tight adherence protein C|nr:type II secretion system F family protein [Bacillota bacterium]